MLRYISKPINKKSLRLPVWAWLSVLVFFTCSGLQADPLQEDTARVGWLQRTAYQLLATDPLKAEPLINQALELSRSTGYLKGEALSLNLKGMQLSDNYLHDSALVCFRKAIKLLRKEPGSSSEIARIKLQEASSLLEVNEPSKALSILLPLLSKAESSGDLQQLSAVNYKIGNVYCRLLQPKRGEKYMRKALQVAKKQPEKLKPEHTKALYGLGMAFSQMSVRDSTNRLISEKACFDSAMSYFQQSLLLAKELNNQNMIGNAYNGIGTMYMRGGNYEASLENMLPALAIFRKQKNLKYEGTVLNNLGTCYLSLGRLVEAKTHLEEALQIGKKTKNQELLQEVEGNLYWLYKDLKDEHNALLHLEKWSVLHDSLFSITQNRQIAELNAKYEADKQARKAELAEALMSKRTLERNGLLAILGILLGAGGLLIRSFRQRQRASAQVNAQKEELNQQKIKDLKWEQKLATIKASLEGQERERLRIGQDLHDRLGSMLSAVKLYFYLPSELKATLPPKQLERHMMANKLLDDSCQEVRRIAHDMVSNMLIRFGLVTALEDITLTLNESNQMRMKLHIKNMNHRLDSVVEVTVYRIIQELIGNVLKHALATEINITLTNQDDKVLHMTFHDNGVSFNPVTVVSGMGMKNMITRATQLGGRLEFDSSPGNGTKVTLVVPLPEQPVLQPSAEPVNEPELTSQQY